MSFNLFQLVPAVYRLRDGQIAAVHATAIARRANSTLRTSRRSTGPRSTLAQQAQLDALVAKSERGPLQSLVMIIEEQLQAFAADLDQLYDDQFIETCAPWVIPYIGDLIGYQSIQGIARRPSTTPGRKWPTPSASAAAKGPVLVLEELARDVTGWGRARGRVLRDPCRHPVL